MNTTEQFVKLISQLGADKTLNGYIQEGFTILNMTSTENGILVLLQKNVQYGNTRIDNEIVDGSIQVGGMRWKY
jgi:hypothetical protein